MIMSKQVPKDQYVKVGNIRMRYWALGDGKSSVILLHGLGGYIENWVDNVAALAHNRRVYALDLVGFGRSDKPQVRYSIPYLTEFVQEFMVVRDVDRATVIGESMGGAIALQFALQYPHQVEKMVLAASAGLGKEISIYLRLMSLPILGELSSRPRRKGAALLLEQLFHDQDLITDQMIEEGYEMSSLPGAQRCLLSALRSMCNIWGSKSEAYHPIFDRLEEIEVPTLVIWGAQDRILPVAHAHQAAKRLANARLHIFDPCGHVPNIERAEEFNALVTNFLSNGELAE
jgi:4,5:9,10-diseco-3-hydroxy-5,9,17-trioxoandrosta-1(10),2-diene-4-oate hydrolase